MTDAIFVVQGMFLSSSSGRGVKVWDVAMMAGQTVQQGGSVTQLLYSPDATQLCVVMDKPNTLRYQSVG